MKIIISQKYKRKPYGIEMSFPPLQKEEPFYDINSGATQMSLPKLNKVQVLKPIPPALHADSGYLMTKNEFKEQVASLSLMDDDGYGLLATSAGISEKVVLPFKVEHKTFTWPKWATHIWWIDQSK